MEGGRHTPASGRAATRGAFVGRERELDQLASALDGALAGRGRLCLVTGEPGIGKSRLTDELAAEARRRGASVLWGRCWEAGGAPAYWPWVQVLRAHISDALPGQIAGEAGPTAPDLASLIPEIRDVLPGLPPAGIGDPETARFRMFDAVTSFLRRMARTKPLVILLDDLHAADAPSLLLLRFVSTQIASVPLLLVGAYRDVELDPDLPIVMTVDELLREPTTTRLELGGLPEADVARLIELMTGRAAPDALVRAVHTETGGNPLFVGELLRLLVAEGELEDSTATDATARLRIPPGVRQTILRRVGHLSEPCRQVLMLASILGRESSLAALERTAQVSPGNLGPQIEEAIIARVLGEVQGAIGRLRFSHALVRDALYEEIPPTRRAELHRRAGGALEALHADDPEPHLAEIAHHFLQAVPAVDPATAIDRAVRAGRWASQHLAYEEAARLYELALQVLDRGTPDGPDTRIALVVALGDARAGAGDDHRAKEAFSRAGDLARREGMPEHLAEAALGFGGRFVWMRPGADARVVPLLEEALAALDPEDSPLRLRLLARLAGALRDEPDRERRASISAEALAMARRTGDPAALAYALSARYAAIWGPDNAEQLLALATELVQVAERTGDRERLLEGTLLRHKALVTLGDMDAARIEHETSIRLADELRQPSHRWYPAADRAWLALFEGRFDEAEPLIREALHVGEKPLGPMEAQVAYRLQLYELRRVQGRVADVEDLIRRSVAEFPGYPMFRAVLASIHAELGRVPQARVVLEDLAAEDFAWLPFDNEWLFGMSFLPEVASFLADADRARTLHDLLAPYARLNAFSPPELCRASVARPAGIAAAAAGRWADAERLLEEAVAAHDRMGARPWAAQVRHDLAVMLAARDGPGDPDRAAELLRSALAEARRLNMSALAQRAEIALGDLRADERAAGPVSAAHPCVFRREGEYWSIAYQGRGIRLRDTKGLRYIHRLLAEPGRELHVAELTGANRGNDRSEGLPLDASQAGPILDPDAKAAYMRRIGELRDDLDEATDWGDPERAAHARTEIEAIAEQLAAAFGLGGRSRRAADTVERIRKAVTNRIRDALARIEREHTPLARHLANSIVTGTFCTYRPDRDIRWKL
jgi:tetratricopeptide (TPR) repeat protein